MTTLQFYVKNKHNNDRFEYVIFTLDKADFGDILFKKLQHFDYDTFLQDLMSKSTDKWRNVHTEWYTYNNLNVPNGKQLFIDNELLQREFTLLRYDVGGVEYNKSKKITSNS